MGGLLCQVRIHLPIGLLARRATIHARDLLERTAWLSTQGVPSVTSSTARDVEARKSGFEDEFSEARNPMHFLVN